YVPNSTLYTVGSRLRYFEAPGHPFSERHHLVTVASSDVLKNILEAAAGGARWADLVSAICTGNDDVSEAEAAEFLEEIVSSQILIADVYPSPVGPEMLPRFLEKIQSLTLGDDLRRAIDMLVTSSQELGAMPVGAGIDTMRRATTQVSDFMREDVSKD